MGEFRMPSLGADMEAGTLVAWRKQPGDRVERGEIIDRLSAVKKTSESGSAFRPSREASMMPAILGLQTERCSSGGCGRS